jgi:hypothetical protein
MTASERRVEVARRKVSRRFTTRKRQCHECKDWVWGDFMWSFRIPVWPIDTKRVYVCQDCCETMEGAVNLYLKSHPWN